jgi:phosphoribosylamine--glycine ligase
MKILVVGGGGREHALAWKIRQSVLTDALYCLPGNGGTAQIATNIPGNAEDVDFVLGVCRDKGIDFVVVGPEGPLVDGLVDRLEQNGIKAFGPSAAAARLEASKGSTKDFCARYHIPTAAYGRFKDAASAKAYATKAWAEAGRLVVKADGLAAGKGVILEETLEETLKAIDAIFAGQFGAAGNEVVIEEYLEGEEASFFALIDGKTALPLIGAQDHKRAFDGDLGPNTGGMGAYSPAPVLTPQMQERVMRDIIEPTVKGMAADGSPYKGVLYAGLMIGPDGPRLIEYNVRFGDPECQVLMMRLKSDILPALMAAADGMLSTVDLRWHDDVALTVVMAAQGYPGSYEKGTEIKGLAEAGAMEGVVVFHAGTRQDGNRLLATGGRVLNVTARGTTVSEAQHRAYAAIDKLDWPEGFCRKDIGWRAVKR